jgi:SAM-dependent methyltransferase
MPKANETTIETRFEFGENWHSFLRNLDDSRIREAERSLQEMLETSDLRGKTFLDVGSGSGLFSLAARRLGASVYSFDFDPKAVNCGSELKRHYRPSDPDWIIAEGSALDKSYLNTLGQYDIVYSWGVLHHTDNMWAALDNVGGLVPPGGQLFIAIYNDQGSRSRRWRKIKWLFNRFPRPLRFVIAIPAIASQLWRPLLKGLLRGRPFGFFKEYKTSRGMSWWHDAVDWVGGYPFEVAKVEQVFEFYRIRGFVLTKLVTDTGSGCNQFIFCRP